MLKPVTANAALAEGMQPPSGGCVLKLSGWISASRCVVAAAFRRLCVETRLPEILQQPEGAAAFRRLCVETALAAASKYTDNAAAFRRLCVETASFGAVLGWFCWQPPSGGCVLKPARAGSNRPRCRQPPSGGCVLKHYVKIGIIICDGSRLQAAVC